VGTSLLGFVAKPWFCAARNQQQMMRKRTSVLHKTQLCKFNSIGECNRGNKCGFAHTAADLHPVPDLSRTKMCPILSKAGICDDSNCRYAHETGQRRKKGSVYFGKSGVSNPSCCIPNTQRKAAAAAAADSTNADVVQVGTVPSQIAACNCDHSKRKLYQDDAEQTIISYGVGMHLMNDDVSTCDFSWTRGTSAGSSSQEAVESSGNLFLRDDDVLQSIPALTDGEQLRQKRGDTLSRTTMCKFHRVGLCSQGAACAFAHSADELRPALDLQCSEVCQVLSHNQVLEDMQCESICVGSNIRACNQDLTSLFLPNPEGAPSNASPQHQKNPHVFEWPCEDGILVVKHTFLSVEPEPSHLRRVMSAPAIALAREQISSEAIS